VLKGALAPGAAADGVDALCPVWRDPEAATAAVAGDRAFRYVRMYGWAACRDGIWLVARLTHPIARLRTL